MRKLFIIILLIFSLNAQDKVIFTKMQLLCLNQTIDRYIKEEANPVFIIVESSCEKEKKKKTELFSMTKELPDIDTIPIDSSKGVSVDDIREFTKEELKCIKKGMPEYLNEKGEQVEVVLKCH